MKNKAMYYSGFIAAAFAAGLCLASDNPNVANPNASGQSFQSRTNPVSAGQSQRFVTKGNTYGTGGNDIVTGNTAGMKYFRGVVPYGSSYYSGAFVGDLGATSVSDFLRRSAEPIVADRSPGRTAGYYDSRRTVSSFQKSDGVSMFSAPPLGGQGRTNSYATPLASLPMENPYRQRPLSSNNQELELLLSRQAELKEKETAKVNPVETQEPFKFKSIFDQTLTPQELQALKDQQSPTPDKEPLDETPQDDPQTNLNNPSKATPEKTDEQTLSVSDKINKDLQAALDSIKPGEGRSVLGEHSTFSSLAEAKSDEYLAAAESFLKAGQFYKAADTFALVSVWKPDDARGYAGQSFALFAAGEYMSSAYYLSRALELDVKLTTRKYDLAALMNDRDVYESRVLELSTWQQRTESGELSLLAAYVLWQDNKLERAGNAMRDAERAMPDSKAVALLKSVILPDNPAQ